MPTLTLQARRISPGSAATHRGTSGRYEIRTLAALRSDSSGSDPPYATTCTWLSGFDASDTAWYCMRGDLPKSPSTTTQVTSAEFASVAGWRPEAPFGLLDAVIKGGGGARGGGALRQLRISQGAR
eukprot:364208-Chlamydomonas_euryale.AAC.12